jgi:osomolarity two-component system sensor histidine kinase SLN1
MVDSKNQIGQQLRLDEKKFSLRDIRSQILAIFEQQAKECKIKLLVRLEEASNANLNGDEQTKGWNDSRPSNFGRLEDMVLWGDEHRIAQVLLNLVSNSLKFTPEGGSVTITIRCTGEINSSEGEKDSMKSRYSPSLNPNMSTAASADEIGLVSKVSQHCATSDVVNDRTPISLEQHPIVHHRSLTLPPGHWLSFEFEVKDTGLGIPEQLQSKIFEPFVQGDLSLNKKYGGTGLGLSICSQLVGLMEGTLTLKSQVGFGSTFIMSIPLKHITSHADGLGNSSVDLATTTLPARSSSIDKTGIPQSTGDTRSMPTMQSTPRAIERIDGAPKTTHALVTSGNLLDSRSAGLSQHSIALASSLERSSSKAIALERAEARGAKRRSTTKVLVAEDNKTNQEVMVRMLALEDVQNVTVVTDGREALDRVKETMRRQDPYDIIFMDIQMPNVDGLQSTRLIRQLGFMAPIVALTAYTEVFPTRYLAWGGIELVQQEKNVHDCLNSGMDFFLSKPIRRPALKHVLETYYPIINSKDNESTSTTNPLKISEST